MTTFICIQSLALIIAARSGFDCWGQAELVPRDLTLALADQSITSANVATTAAQSRTVPCDKCFTERSGTLKALS